MPLFSICPFELQTEPSSSLIVSSDINTTACMALDMRGKYRFEKPLTRVNSRDNLVGFASFGKLEPGERRM